MTPLAAQWHRVVQPWLAWWQWHAWKRDGMRVEWGIG
jgi:hypothetical protein